MGEYDKKEMDILSISIGLDCDILCKYVKIEMDILSIFVDLDFVILGFEGLVRCFSERFMIR